MPDTIKQCTETKQCQTSLRIYRKADSNLGKKFNNWFIVAKAGRDRQGRMVYKVRCECGYETKKNFDHIKCSQRCRNCYRKKKTKSREYIHISKLCKNCVESNKL